MSPPTDVASYLFKISPAARPFLPLIRDKHHALSFVSVAQLLKWTIKHRWGAARIDALEQTLQKYVVLPYDQDAASTWARLSAGCEQVGRKMEDSDAWVAACALRHDLSLVTNNVKHFETARSLFGLKLLLPS